MPDVNRPIRSDRVLELLAALGAASPEQLVAADAGTMPSRLELTAILEGDAVVVRLAREGTVTVNEVPCPRGALRVGDRRLWRLTDAGLHARIAASRAHQGTLAVIAALGGRAGTAWVDERDVHAARYPASRSAPDVRHRLRALEAKGWLAGQRTRLPGHVRIVTLTDAGRRAIAALARHRGRSIALPIAAPSPANRVHHLLTVAAALQHVSEQGGRIVRLLGDVELRRDSRRGRRTQVGDRLDAIPDGTVVYRPAGATREGGARTVSVEVLVSGYTTTDLRAKYDAAFAEHTVFFATTARLQGRITRLGLPRPTLLSALRDQSPGSETTGRRIANPPHPPATAIGHPATAIPRRARHAANAAVLELLDAHRGATLVQIARCLGHVGRAGTSYAAALVRRLRRRGLVRTVRIYPAMGRASPLAVLLTARSTSDGKIGARHREYPPAIGGGGQRAITAQRRLLEALHETEMQISRLAAGWRFLTDAEQPSAWRAYLRHRAHARDATEHERWRWQDVRSADTPLALGLPVLADGATSEVRVLLRASELGTMIARLGGADALSMIGVLPIELVSASRSDHHAAEQQLAAWAARIGLAVRIAQVPHPLPTQPGSERP